MNRKIENIKNYRLYLLGQLDGLSTQQLNAIPAGYSNNLVWNLAHLVSVAQNLGYVRAGLPIAVDDRYFSPYLPGTKPERFIDEPEIQTIKALCITSVDGFQADYAKNRFGNYSPSAGIRQVYGVEVSTIDEAIDYLLYHEGFHGGYMLSLKRLLQRL
ncbi:MAG: DinB family protein [Cytophagales bacterium]|nr:DinB family protein [Cytophagales bacterium]